MLRKRQDSRIQNKIFLMFEDYAIGIDTYILCQPMIVDLKINFEKSKKIGDNDSNPKLKLNKE